MPKHIVSTPPLQVEPGAELFEKAEKLFQEKSYDKALEAYQEYLRLHSDRHFAAAALFKIASIPMEIGKDADFCDIYKGLFADYKENFIILDALVEILASLYSQGKYNEVIKHASCFAESIDSRVHLLRTYILLGDAYSAAGLFVDALHSYAKAYNKSKDQEKATVLARLNKAAGKLDTTEIKSFIGKSEDIFLKSHLMYQLAYNYAENEKYDDALQTLTEFIERYPLHEYAQQANRLADEINDKAISGLFTIGCLLPLSGQYNVFGNKALRGIELALEQFSRQNAGFPIRIIIKDTGSDPDKAAIAVRELNKEHVAAIIGPIFAAESAAIEAQSKKIPIITITQKHNITDIGNYVFRNFFTPKMQVQAIVSYAIDELGLSRFAILYPDENYGTTFMNLFWDEVISYGGTIVGIESYNINKTDFADSIKKLVGMYYEVPEDIIKADIPDFAEEINTDEKKNNEKPEAIVDFDAVFIPDEPKRAGLILPQLAFYDIENVYLFGTNLWHSDRLIKMALKYAQGAIMTDIFFAESSSIKVRKFAGNFKKTYQEMPGFIEAVFYDTATLLFDTASRFNIRFRSEFKDELLKLDNFQGVTGFTSFDNNGEVRKNLYLLQIKGKRFIELERF